MAGYSDCKSHEAVEKELKDHDDRIRGLEKIADEQKVLTAKLGTLVDWLQRTYWVLVTAFIGFVATLVYFIITS